MQSLRRLSGRRRARQDAGLFIVDGPVLLAEALASDLTVVDVYVESGAARAVADMVEGSSARVVQVADGTLVKVTDPVTSQGVAATVAIPRLDPQERIPAGLVLVAVELADPGNLGTIVRTAEAAGAAAVVSLGDAVDIWSPKCVRAAAGSSFRVPVVCHASIEDGLEALRSSGHRRIATVLGGPMSIYDLDLTGDVALLLGNEARGLADWVAERADLVASVPMEGRVESLNVATCAAVVSFESQRQRRAARSQP